MLDDEAGRDFLTLIADAGELTMQRGKVRGLPSAHFAELRGEERSNRGSDQRNKAIRPSCLATG